MITLITGAPGSGKSAALVDLLMTLSKGRTIYVNGIPDLVIPHEVLEDPTKWPDVVPDGSVVVIDEVQRIWRPRGPGQKVPPDIQALETHRHRGLDFYIVTQGPRLVDANVRALTGRHVHLRDVGLLGRYWYEWPECNDTASTSWKNAPIKKRYRLPKAAFSLYKSASVHIKPVRSVPWMLAVMVAALVAAGGASFKAYSSISEKLGPAQPFPSVEGVSPGLSQLGPAPEPSPTLSPVDYAASFEPRVAGLPHTAPRYDQGSTPVAVPYPAACVSMGPRCDCYTQQGTKLVTPRDICLQIVKYGLFLDWVQPGQTQVASASSLVVPSPGISPAPVAIAMQAPAAIKAP
jgi:zona occludens toxin